MLTPALAASREKSAQNLFAGFRGVRCSSSCMNDSRPSPEETKFQELLRSARPTSELPPRFQENVWRRIEHAEARHARVAVGWLDALAAWVLRPQLAFAVAAVVIFTGAGLGWSRGERLAQNEAQARYVSAVAPSLLR
jgi:hypothetical protein